MIYTICSRNRRKHFFSLFEISSIRHFCSLDTTLYLKVIFFCQHHILQALHRIQQFMGKFNQNWTKKEAYTIPKNSFV